MLYSPKGQRVLRESCSQSPSIFPVGRASRTAKRTKEPRTYTSEQVASCLRCRCNNRRRSYSRTHSHLYTQQVFRYAIYGITYPTHIQSNVLYIYKFILTSFLSLRPRYLVAFLRHPLRFFSSSRTRDHFRSLARFSVEIPSGSVSWCIARKKERERRERTRDTQVLVNTRAGTPTLFTRG